MILESVLLTTVGALIGWGTNYIAIRMLFHPREPIVFLGFTIQGLLPRRKQDLANSIAHAVAGNLLPMEHLVDRLNIEGYKEGIVTTVEQHARVRTDELLPRFVPDHWREGIVRAVGQLVAKETVRVVDNLAVDIITKLKTEVDIAAIVEEKVNELDLKQLENLVLSVASRELRYIELFGLLLGGLVGFGQAVLLAALRLAAS